MGRLSTTEPHWPGSFLWFLSGSSYVFPTSSRFQGGSLCVIDWKTSEKPKPFIRNTFDNPLQVVAYVGAINHDGNYSFQVHCGLIVVAYKDGSPAHPHFMDPELCSQYWEKWLLRLEEYTKKEKDQKPD
uniref:Mitochondrial genome maintenance exonuclease 1 n=1 Tax=Molossus molossus TaxID=27622 RepID=A0A7J8HIG7_MOLMO|nr:mitochondrial genome maintenance exonuclease 1 [Molossus molossus]